MLSSIGREIRLHSYFNKKIYSNEKENSSMRNKQYAELTVITTTMSNMRCLFNRIDVGNCCWHEVCNLNS